MFSSSAQKRKWAQRSSSRLLYYGQAAVKKQSDFSSIVSLFIFLSFVAATHSQHGERRSKMATIDKSITLFLECLKSVNICPDSLNWTIHSFIHSVRSCIFLNYVRFVYIFFFLPFGCSSPLPLPH